MKIDATTSETRKKKISKSSITSWILFHGIFMTSCDKILNQDVLTRNRCYGGATLLCGTRLAHVCQEPVSTTLDLLCVCFGSSTLSVLRVKKQGLGGWARCPRQYFLPALHWATRILARPHQASSLVGEMMNWRIGHLSCYLISYEFTNRDIWMCLTLPSFLNSTLISEFEDLASHSLFQLSPCLFTHSQLLLRHFSFSPNTTPPSELGWSISCHDTFLANKPWSLRFPVLWTHSLPHPMCG